MIYITGEMLQEAAWVLSNIAAGSLEHKQLIFSSEVAPLLLHLLSNAPFDIRKEVAYTLGNLCVAPSDSPSPPSIILHHLVTLVDRGCLPGFISLVRSPDIEAARLGLQFLELVSDPPHELLRGSQPICFERQITRSKAWCRRGSYLRLCR